MDEYISFQDAEFLSQTLQQATEEEFYEQNSIDWNKLQMSAMNFLKGYEILDKNEQAQKKQIRRALISQDPTSSTNFLFQFQQQHKDAYFTRAKYLLAFNFDAQLTAFLGELPKEAVYTIWDSSTKSLKSYKISMASLARLASAEGRLMLNVADLKKENAQQLEKDDTIGGIDKDHIVEAQAAYRGTAARLGQYYNKIQAKWTQRKNGLLMWKEYQTWVVARVTSYGDAKEGYIAALMTKHKSNLDALFNHNLGTERYYDDQLISSFFYNYIAKVTNKAAIVEEDVVSEKGQYAVKSAGASMPSITQYLKTAQEIVSRSEMLNPVQVKQIINELYPADAVRNIIVERINIGAENETNSILSQLQKTALGIR